MLETIVGIFQNTKECSTSLFLGAIVSGAAVWFVSNEFNDRRVLALEGEKNQLIREANSLKYQLKLASTPLTPPVVKSNPKKDCQKIENLIAHKKSEAATKEREVRIAAPSMVNEKRTDPNSLYNRRLKELEATQKHINQLNDNLIKCIS